MSDQTQQPSRAVKGVLFALIIVAALVFRFWGLAWDLPDSMHFFSLHPDENLILSCSLPDFGGVSIFTGKFLPHYYNYGSLPFYENSFFLSFASAYHYFGSVMVRGVIDPFAFGRALLVARALSALFGVGTVWATYALARRLYNEWSALIAAAFLAVMPLHAQHSHYATVDIGAAFWQTLSMVYAAKVIGATKWTLKYTILAAVTAGLCAATKYSGALVMLCLAAALYFRVTSNESTKPQAFRLALTSLAVFVATFVIACPGSVFDSAKFLQGIAYESDHVMHHGEIYFQGTGPGWIYIVTRNLDAGMGLPLLILAGVGMVWSLIKMLPGDTLLIAYFLPTYLLLGSAQSRYARYEVALLPVLAVYAGRLVANFLSKKQEQDKEQAKRPIGALAAVVGAAILVFTAFDTWNLLLPMTQPDPRELAAQWIESRQPPPKIVALGTPPWFFTATINPFFAWYVPDSWRKMATSRQIAMYCYNPDKPLDPGTVASCNAPVTTVSEFEYYDPMRLNQTDAVAYFSSLRSKYGAPHVFESHHPLGGITEIGGLPTQDLPTDMLYPSPTVLVFASH